MKNRKPVPHSTPSSDALLEAAVSAAKAAGKILTHYFRGTFTVREKKGAGLVTNADCESEEKVIQILHKKFPHFSVLAEESHARGDKHPRFNHDPEKMGRWMIDPLDGTTNFVHGFPMFCVSIAAEVQGELKVGVIYHPILKELYTAVQGKGAFLNGRRIHVSATRTLKDSLLTTGFSYRKNKTMDKELNSFSELSKVTRAVRRPGSAALDLAYTARGTFDGFWERHLSAWDVAAGALLITEAGGHVSNLRGGPLDLHSGEIVGSNKVLHRSLLKALR